MSHSKFIYLIRRTKMKYASLYMQSRNKIVIHRLIQIAQWRFFTRSRHVYAMSGVQDRNKCISLTFKKKKKTPNLICKWHALAHSGTQTDWSKSISLNKPNTKLYTFPCASVQVQCLRCMCVCECVCVNLYDLVRVPTRIG